MRATIVYGFLGAGKTTLLRSVMPRLTKIEPTVLLVNEFGVEGTDQIVFASDNLIVRELTGGCVCCEVRGELLLALDQIHKTLDPARLVIEPTGLASPDTFGNVFGSPAVRSSVTVDSIITVIDASNFALVRDSLGEFYPRQVGDADLVVINKQDVASEAQRAEAHEWARSLNPSATVIETVRCNMDPDVVVATIRQGHARIMGEAPSEGLRAGTHDGLSALGLQRVVLTTDAWDSEMVERFVQDLANEAYGEVIRAKGFVPTGTGSLLIDVVLGGWEIRPFGLAPSRIDVIGRNLAPYEMEQVFKNGITEFTRTT
jgi:G3E family GTPase